MSTARWVVMLTASVGLSAAVAEGLVRWVHPTPRAQVVRGGEALKPDVRPIKVLHGHPTWDELGSVPRRNLDCVGEDTIDILMLGSSIFFGSGYQAEQVMSAALQEALDAEAPGRWCVLNFGQPGYISGAKLALAREYIPSLNPELVLWELWTNDPGDFTMLGDDAYNLTQLRVDSAGYPQPLTWLPEGIHHALFHHSELWWYGSLALTPRVPGASHQIWEDFVVNRLPALKEITDAQGSDLSLVFTPPLDTDFATSAARTAKSLKGYVAVSDWADEQDIPQLDLAAGLEGVPVESVRHDPCCHYNEEGHRQVAMILKDWVKARWAARARDVEAAEPSAPEEVP